MMFYKDFKEKSSASFILQCFIGFPPPSKCMKLCRYKL